jgi:hypothetical protein
VGPRSSLPKEPGGSPYYYLFKDEDFRRWFDNVKRGSANTAYEWFRRFGRIHKRFGYLPKDFVKMGERKTVAFILDMVTELELEKKSGSYISNNVKPIKNWMSFNGITIGQRIKISRRNDLVTVDDEKIPMQDDLIKSLFQDKVENYQIKKQELRDRDGRIEGGP